MSEESPLSFINRRMSEIHEEEKNKKKSYTGVIVKKLWGVGTKSEHDAVVLVTKDKEYVLRLVGGNPFQDDRLDELLKNTGEVTLEGQLINDYTLVIEPK